MADRDGFTDRVVLVTGGGSGIGAAVARRLALEGAVVWVTDLHGKRAADVAASIRDAGHRAVAATLDVTDADAFQARVEEVVAEHGRLDYLFNNAGIGIAGEVRDMPQAAWDRIFDVNLRGVVHGIRAAYPRMIEQGSGHIFNTACIAGLVPFPMTAAYCATKHAIVALSTALRAEAAEHGVRVSVVCPGTVDTGMFDAIEYINVDKSAIVSRLGPALVPVEKCAKAIVRGVRRDQAIITVSAHARLTWWLYRLMPRTFLKITARGFRLARPRLRSQ